MGFEDGRPAPLEAANDATKFEAKGGWMAATAFASALDDLDEWEGNVDDRAKEHIPAMLEELEKVTKEPDEIAVFFRYVREQAEEHKGKHAEDAGICDALIRAIDAREL